MNFRTQLALNTLKAGGYFRKQLETQYNGREQFVMRLRNAQGQCVKGVGFKTFLELESQLIRKECERSSVWAQEWKLNEVVAA